MSVDPFSAECRKRGIPANRFFDYEARANPQHLDGRVPQECVDACQACPIRVICLDWSLAHESHGYWAGTRRNARNKLRKQLGIRLIKTNSPPPWWSNTED